jgi:hypothetical protein
MQRRFTRRGRALLPNAGWEALAPDLPRAAGAVAGNRPLRDCRALRLDAALRNTLACTAPARFVRRGRQGRPLQERGGRPTPRGRR